MGAGGIADQADAIRVEVEIGRLGVYELDRRFGVVDRGGIHARLPQPVVDGKYRVAEAREEQAPIPVRLPTAGSPAAAVDGYQDRSFGMTFGQIEVAGKHGPIMLGINQVGPVHDLIFHRGRMTGRQQQRQRGDECEFGEHRRGLRGMAPNPGISSAVASFRADRKPTTRRRNDAAGRGRSRP
jgi:hypothetical protein